MNLSRYFPNPYINDECPEVLVYPCLDLWCESAMKFIHEAVQSAKEELSSPQKSLECGLYLGASGTLHVLCRLLRNKNFQSYWPKLARDAAELCVSCEHSLLTPSRNAPNFSFILGAAGVIAVCAEARMLLNETEDALQLLRRFELVGAPLAQVDQLQPLRTGSDELFVGRAGFLCGARFLNRLQILDMASVDLKLRQTICNLIIQSGQLYSTNHHSSCPLMFSYYETEYLGAAHGLVGILLELLCCPGPHLQSPLLRNSVDYLIQVTEEGRGLPCANDELGSHNRPPEAELVHWCHGAPGAIYLYARAFLVWKKSTYLQAALACGDVIWRKGLLRKGPGLCHGVAGNGYAFLLLYRITSQPVWLWRAQKFAHYMLTDAQFKAEAFQPPEQAHLIYEGVVGTAAFLADLIEPQSAEFPFYDVFSDL